MAHLKDSVKTLIGPTAHNDPAIRADVCPTCAAAIRMAGSRPPCRSPVPALSPVRRVRMPGALTQKKGA